MIIQDLPNNHIPSWWRVWVPSKQNVSSGRSLCFLCTWLPVTFIERGHLCSFSPLQIGERSGCGFHLSQVCPCHSFNMGLPSALESLSETQSWPLMTLMLIPTQANELMWWDHSSFFFRSRPRRQPTIRTPEGARLGKHLPYGGGATAKWNCKKQKGSWKANSMGHALPQGANDLSN